MPLREILFEAAAPHDPVCEVTRSHEDVRAVCRVMDAGLEDGVARCSLTVLGDREVTGSLLKRMRTDPRYPELEVVNLTPYAMVLKVGERVDGDSVNLLAEVWDRFGEDTLIDPFFIDAGRARVRALVARDLSTRQALQNLRDLQAAAPWEHFRVVRVDEFDPVEHARLLRRVLSPEQENLLRLAVDMGYYATPKGCTLEDIAERVGLTASPVHKRLKRAEQVLVTSHLDPGSVPYPEDVRGTPPWIREMTPNPGTMMEVDLRVRWPSFPMARFTASRRTQVVVRPFVQDPRSGEVSCLLVVASPEGAHDGFEAEVLDPLDLAEVELLSRDGDHCTYRLRARDDVPWSRSPVPFTRLVRRFGRDAFLHPVVVEGGDVWLSFVVARHLPAGKILERLEEAGGEVGWEGFDLVSVRNVRGDPAEHPREALRELTPRQREVLEIARALGYYRTPRSCTLEDVARTLGVSGNAVHKNLTAAERKILTSYVRGNP